MNALAATCRRLLVPLDGSPEAESVIPYVRSLAACFRAKVELVRAYAPSASLMAAAAATSLPGTGPLLDTGPYIAAGRGEAETYLEEVEARLRREGLDVVHRQLEGSPGQSIVEEAQRSNADMIAMTTHGRGGLDRLVHGSVASYVSQHSSLPVLLVRPTTVREVS